MGKDAQLHEFTEVLLRLGPNSKVISAHCGNEFSLLLTSQGEVYSAGSGKHGIHCSPRLDDCFEFTLLEQSCFGGLKVTYLAVGEDHAAAITVSGQLWCWGDNSHGQCGFSVPEQAVVS